MRVLFRVTRLTWLWKECPLVLTSLCYVGNLDPPDRQPPEANVRALRPYRLTITEQIFQWHAVCLFGLVSCVYPLYITELWHILQLDVYQHCPASAPRFKQSLQRTLANGKYGQLCGLIWSRRVLNCFFLSCYNRWWVWSQAAVAEAPGSLFGKVKDVLK